MFASDNAAPVHPAILDAMIRANDGLAASYGADPWTARAEALLRETFQTECAILMVATGTAANALALSALMPPWGAVFTHRHAHIVQDEAGAPEFFTGGARLLLLDGPSAKLTPEGLKAAASGYSRAWVHGSQPFVVSISQATESGAVYSADETAKLGEACRELGLTLHIDGARFANAVVASGASPADLSWRAGAAALSFGATKNGALAAEAVVCFDAEAAAALPYLRKRSGHLLSKHRFLGAQLVAYLENGLWLDLARRANDAARALADRLVAEGGVLLHAVDANEVFVRLPQDLADAIGSRGAAFYPWSADGPDAYRFVASWRTTDAEIAAISG